MNDKSGKRESIKEKICYLKKNLSEINEANSEQINKIFTEIIGILEYINTLIESYETVITLEEDSVFICPVCEEQSYIDEQAFIEKEWIRLRCESCGEMIFVSQK